MLVQTQWKLKIAIIMDLYAMDIVLQLHDGCTCVLGTDIYLFIT
jgi:hypothetical protein